MGKLFVIDGTDGSGKQTQLNKLQEKLKEEGISITVEGNGVHDFIS